MKKILIFFLAIIVISQNTAYSSESEFQPLKQNDEFVDNISEVFLIDSSKGSESLYLEGTRRHGGLYVDFKIVLSDEKRHIVESLLARKLLYSSILNELIVKTNGRIEELSIRIIDRENIGNYGHILKSMGNYLNPGVIVKTYYLSNNAPSINGITIEMKTLQKKYPNDDLEKHADEMSPKLFVEIFGEPMENMWNEYQIPTNSTYLEYVRELQSRGIKFFAYPKESDWFM